MKLLFKNNTKLRKKFKTKFSHITKFICSNEKKYNHFSFHLQKTSSSLRHLPYKFPNLTSKNSSTLIFNKVYKPNLVKKELFQFHSYDQPIQKFFYNSGPLQKIIDRINKENVYLKPQISFKKSFHTIINLNEEYKTYNKIQKEEEEFNKKNNYNKDDDDDDNDEEENEENEEGEEEEEEEEEEDEEEEEEAEEEEERDQFNLKNDLLNKNLTKEELLKKYNIRLEKGKIKVVEEDLLQKFVKGSGKGGQKVNKTNNAVFLKHIPTGFWVKEHSTRYGDKNRVLAHKKLLFKLDIFINGDDSKFATKVKKIQRRKSKKMIGGSTKTILKKLEQEEDQKLKDKEFQNLSKIIVPKIGIYSAIQEAYNYLSQKIIFKQQNETEEARISSIRFDIEVLLSHILKTEREFLLLDRFRELSLKECETFLNCIFRRSRYEPVSYIIGYRHFYKSKFKVDSSTLIPRPSTETLIEHALELYPDKNSKKLDILELGVGSGCLLLSALKEFSKSHGIGIDINELTLKTAEENAKSLSLLQRVSFLKSNWFESLKEAQNFDLIFSNPPYIPISHKNLLDPTVHLWEPFHSLFSGENGIDDYEKIANQLQKNNLNILRKNGILILEVGFDQAKIVREIFLKILGLQFLSSKFDLDGVERSLAFKKIK